MLSWACLAQTSTKQLIDTEFQKGGKYSFIRSFVKAEDILNAIMCICPFPDFMDNLYWSFAKRKGALLQVL